MTTNGVLAALGPGGWDWGHMGGGWLWWVWGLLTLTLLLSIGVLVVWLATRAGADRHPAPPRERSPLDRAQEVLAERYARGEISTEEYRERLANLSHRP